MQQSFFKGNAPKEGEIQKAIIDLLRLRGCFIWRQNVGSFKVGDRFVSMGYKGISDILGIYKNTGRMLAIEVKRPKTGILSEAQVAFLRSIRSHGGIAMVATSLDDIVRLLDDPGTKSEEKYEKLLG